SVCSEASLSTFFEAVRSIYRSYEIRSVIKFPPLHRESAVEIHCQREETYGPEVISCQHVYKWIRLFKEGRTHTRSGKLWHLSSETKNWVLLVDFIAKKIP
ncbi:hypothetical protein AAG570_012735, partial [Ranatra chinensis]